MSADAKGESIEKEPENDVNGDEGTPASQLPLPGGDFRLFLAKLQIQGLFSLGLIENPITKRTELNLPHAQTIIDDLLMLRDKTSGNLDQGETAQLNKIISDLQFQFVERSKKKA